MARGQLQKAFNPMPSQEEVDEFVRVASLGNTAAVKKFLKEYPAAIDTKDNMGWAALMEAAALGKKSTVELLLEKGADINTKDNDGWTVLMRATWNRHIDIVKLLLEKGADYEAKNIKGETAYALALQHCATPIVLLLRDWPETYKQRLEEQQAREEEQKAQDVAAEIANFSPALKRDIPAPRILKIPSRKMP